MIDYINSKNRIQMIKYIKEYYLSGDIIQTAKSGGMLNAVNNPYDSVVRLQDEKKSYILKIATSNENVYKFFDEVLMKFPHSSKYVDKIVREVLNFFPEQRECQLYNELEKVIPQYIPSIQYLGINTFEKQSYILMEDLSDYYKFNILEKNDTLGFNEIFTAIRDMARIHSALYKIKIDFIPKIDYNYIKYHKKFFEEVIMECSKKYSQILDKQFFKILYGYLDGMEENLAIMNEGPYTVTHNDFNVRNCCFDCNMYGELRLKVFDWDTARIQNPHFDLMEFFMFLTRPLTEDEFLKLLVLYKDNAGAFLHMDSKQFYQLLHANLVWFSLYKFGSYSLVTTVPVKLLKLLSNNICRYERLLSVCSSNLKFRI